MFTLFGKLDELKSQPALNTEGVGLGLIICKKIVENSGGKIECYSNGEGQGSVFMFSMHMTLPVKQKSSMMKNNSLKMSE